MQEAAAPAPRTTQSGSYMRSAFGAPVVWSLQRPFIVRLPDRPCGRRQLVGGFHDAEQWIARILLGTVLAIGVGAVAVADDEVCWVADSEYACIGYTPAGPENSYEGSSVDEPASYFPWSWI